MIIMSPPRMAPRLFAVLPNVFKDESVWKCIGLSPPRLPMSNKKML